MTAPDAATSTNSTREMSRVSMISKGAWRPATIHTGTQTLARDVPWNTRCFLSLFSILLLVGTSWGGVMQQAQSGAFQQVSCTNCKYVFS